MTELNPEDFNYFRTKRRQVQSSYDLGTAQNQAQRSMAGNQYTRNVGDLAYAYGRAREKHGWSHGARGIQNSGIERKDLYDLAMEGWVRPAANMAGQFQDVSHQLIAPFDLSVVNIRSETAVLPGQQLVHNGIDL